MYQISSISGCYHKFKKGERNEPSYEHNYWQIGAYCCESEQFKVDSSVDKNDSFIIKGEKVIGIIDDYTYWIDISNQFYLL